MDGSRSEVAKEKKTQEKDRAMLVDAETVGRVAEVRGLEDKKEQEREQRLAWHGTSEEEKTELQEQWKKEDDAARPVAQEFELPPVPLVGVEWKDTDGGTVRVESSQDSSGNCSRATRS